MTESEDAPSDRSVLESLKVTACRARSMNWSPYTGAVVVAAVRTTSGQCYGGSNVEIANISLSKHAEEVAALVALASGAMTSTDAPTKRQLIDAVYTTATPCGSCRQFLLEFATEDCIVYVDDGPGQPDAARLADLLPRAFGPEQQAAAQRLRAEPT